MANSFFRRQEDGRISAVYKPRVRTGTKGKTPIGPIPSAPAIGTIGMSIRVRGNLLTGSLVPER